MQKFLHTVSKGTKFNQIYIPREWRGAFEPGDEVEVRLVKKAHIICRSRRVNKLNPLKEAIVKKIFEYLGKHHQVAQLFIFGSFITEMKEFRDIDILVIMNKGGKIGQKTIAQLKEIFHAPYHIVTIPLEQFSQLLEICPLTRAMLFSAISNSPMPRLPKPTIDKNHIKFLLMLPEDLLEVNAGSRAFYLSIRRLLYIKTFLEGKEAYGKAEQEMELFIPKNLLTSLRENEEIEEPSLKILRTIIAKEVAAIKKLL